MSDTKPGTHLSAEELKAVSGGETCVADDINLIIDSLKQNYEALIEFTTYVMERVSGTGEP